MQIEFINAGYTYKNAAASPIYALKDLTFSVPKGQFLALIGSSGAGKSTLAMLLSGLFMPDRGKVLVNDKQASGKSVFKDVGVVFQYPEQQFFCETVYDEIAFGALNFGVKKEDLDQIITKSLTDAGLDKSSFIKRSPFSLSGGEKRRVAIASVLALGSDILIFDEPTAGLDVKGRRWIMDLALQKNKEGKTVIWISHNMDEVATLAQRVLVMNIGQLIMDGTPQEIFSEKDRLSSIGLTIPRASQLLRSLKGKGFNLPAKALTIEGAYEEIIEAERMASC